MQFHSDRRVVVTGLGAVTPIGIGWDAFWKGLLSGRNGIGPIMAFDASEYPCRIAAEVHDFDPNQYFERKKARLLARGTQFGIASALLCLEDAGWNDDATSDRLGVFAGISNSPQDAVERAVMSLRDHGYRRALPYQLNKSLPHAAASEAGLRTGFQENVLTFSTACTAGFNALGYAVEEIRCGRSDAILCVAADANIAQYAFGYFCRAGMLTSCNDDPERASRPFDAQRDGGVLGEAGACFLLEDLKHARQRGATVRAEILGYGTTGAGYRPDLSKDNVAEGMATALTRALMAANCSSRQIDYVGAHGVSDPLLDRQETEAIKAALGEDAYRVPVSSVKAQTGIPQNVAAPLQLMAAIGAMKHDVIPPTMNYEVADPQCDLDYVPNVPRRNRVSRALVLSHGFNGSDAAILIGRPPGS